MRLLIVNDNHPHAVNGVVTTFRNVIGHVAELTDCEILTVTPDDFSHIHGWGYPDLKIPINPWTLAGIVDRFDPSHIHIATEGVLGITAKLLLDSRSWRYTTSFHTRWDVYAQKCLGFTPWGLRHALRKFHSRSSAVLVTTPGMQQQVQELGIHNTVVWSRGVDHAQFAFADHAQNDPPVLLSVGRISSEKNVQAFCELGTQDYQLRVVGDGPQLAALQHQYPNVQFLGALQGAALVAEYQAADVFVFASHSDTFGLVITESMATGTPVAAHPVQGPMDVVDQGQTGWLDHDLKLAVQQCLKLNRSHVHQHSQKWSWRTVAQTFVDHLVFKQ